MPYANDQTAFDEVFGVLNAAVIAAVPDIVPVLPAIRWPGQFEDSAPDVSKMWGRVSTQTVAQQKANLENGEVDNNRYHTDAILFLQLFAPLTDPAAFDVMNALAEETRDAYRGRQVPGGASFKNQRKRELPNDNKFYRCNVIVEFGYDVIGG